MEELAKIAASALLRLVTCSGFFRNPEKCGGNPPGYQRFWRELGGKESDIMMMEVVASAEESVDLYEDLEDPFFPVEVEQEEGTSAQVK